jgi:hypothetical protein
LHTKLGLINVWRAVDKQSEGVSCLSQHFSKVSEVKMKEGIFVGAQITQYSKSKP